MFGIEFQPVQLLAEAAQQPAKPAPPASSPLDGMLLPLVLIMVLFYFLILRPQKSKEQQFRTMIDNLKETDRVVTIGGIHGVVTNVQRDAKIVTIRVDDSTGTKLRVGASAIAQVINNEEKPG